MSGTFRAGKKCGHNVYLGDMPIAAAFSPEWGGIIATALGEYFAAHPQLDPMAVIATPPWSAAEIEAPKCPVKIWSRLCILDVGHANDHLTADGHTLPLGGVPREDGRDIYSAFATRCAALHPQWRTQCVRNAPHFDDHESGSASGTFVRWPVS